MTAFVSNIPPVARRFAAGLLLALALSAALAARGDAEAADPLGPGAKSEPNCPTPKNAPSYLGCQVFGHVTGFQISTGDGTSIHRVPEDGRIVAWRVQLGTPEDTALEYFQQNLPDATFDTYGTNPVAGLSILKPQDNGKFKLTKSSPIVNLTNSLGENPIFTLRNPLRVRAGTIVGLTTPTWVTNFAGANKAKSAPLSDENVWRASRKPERCTTEVTDDGMIDDSNLTRKSHPHTKKGSIRRYGCVYRGAQILYTAYFVPDGGNKDGKGGGGGGKG